MERARGYLGHFKDTHRRRGNLQVNRVAATQCTSSSRAQRLTSKDQHGPPRNIMTSSRLLRSVAPLRNKGGLLPPPPPYVRSGFAYLTCYMLDKKHPSICRSRFTSLTCSSTCFAYLFNEHEPQNMCSVPFWGKLARDHGNGPRLSIMQDPRGQRTALGGGAPRRSLDVRTTTTPCSEQKVSIPLFKQVYLFFFASPTCSMLEKKML